MTVTSQRRPRVTDPSHEAMSVKPIAWGRTQASSGQMPTIVFVRLQNGDSDARLTELFGTITPGAEMQNEETAGVLSKYHSYHSKEKKASVL